MDIDEGRRHSVWAEHPVIPTPATVAQRLLIDRAQLQGLEALYDSRRDVSPRGSHDFFDDSFLTRRSRDRSGRPSVEESPKAGQAWAGSWRHSPLRRRPGGRVSEERERGRIPELDPTAPPLSPNEVRALFLLVRFQIGEQST